jgi:hypothetical protein
VVTYNPYRTVVSGCGGLAIGKFVAALTSQYPFVVDNGQVGDGTTPPGANTSVAKSCIGTAANPELYCTEVGTSSTPTFTCSGSTAGWDYHITAATSTPFVKVCNGTSFVTAY